MTDFLYINHGLDINCYIYDYRPSKFPKTLEETREKGKELEVLNLEQPLRKPPLYEILIPRWRHSLLLFIPTQSTTGSKL